MSAELHEAQTEGASKQFSSHPSFPEAGERAEDIDRQRDAARLMAVIAGNDPQRVNVLCAVEAKYEGRPESYAKLAFLLTTALE